MTLSDDEFIEKFAFSLEKSGKFPRIAGKIFAYLLISDPPEQSAMQLIEKLNVSKSSVSYMVRLLMETGLIQETMIPGKRSTYYLVKEKGWEKKIIERLKIIFELRKLLNHGRLLLKGKNPVLVQRIEKVDEVYTFFEEELKRIIEKWEKRSVKND